MPLPRPASPRALWADIRAFTSERRPHHWVALALAVSIPLGIIFIFDLDGRTNIAPGPQLIYVESWPANRAAAPPPIPMSAASSSEDGIVVGRGATAPGGRPHAEAVALAEAGEAARGATSTPRSSPAPTPASAARPAPT
jgi:hypothetical protein